MDADNISLEQKFRLAARDGQGNVVLAFLTQGLDVNVRTPSGWTALMMAADDGRASTVKILLDHGADVHARTSGGQTPLSCAVGSGKAEVVRMLLAHGADLNEDGDMGKEYLDIAKLYQLSDVEAVLREYGAVDDKAVLSDDEVQFILKSLREGDRIICDVCGGNLTCRVDASGQYWHIFCPEGCTDVTYPKQESEK